MITNYLDDCTVKGPAPALVDRTKRWVFVYGRSERARAGLRALADLAGPGAVAHPQQMRVDFAEGGFVRFVSVNDPDDLHRFRGLEVDDFWCEESVAQRLAPHPLLALLALRRRS